VAAFSEPAVEPDGVGLRTKLCEAEKSQPVTLTNAFDESRNFFVIINS
jgi:hypothetical protein